MFQHVSHESLKPFVRKDSRILILGSFPSVESRKENFYYAHKTNRFFPVLSMVFEEKTPLTTEERKEFLIRHHIALYDVIYECDIEASKDSSVRNIVPSDIKDLIKDTDIRHIITTGSLSDKLYKKYIGNDNIALPSTSAANASYSIDKLFNEYKIIRELVSH